LERFRLNPPGVPEDIPPEIIPVEKAVEEVIAVIAKPMNDFIDGTEKSNAYATTGRRADYEHCEH
jgi:hypothetical protein